MAFIPHAIGAIGVNYTPNAGRRLSFAALQPHTSVSRKGCPPALDLCAVAGECYCAPAKIVKI
jgi:hypothetical protein